MKLLRLIYCRLYGLLFKRRIEREMEEEMLFHMRMRASVNAAAGLTDLEAERQATRHFGRMDVIKEYCLDVKGGGMIDTLLQDLRFGARLLIAKPAFTIVAVVTLALGVGASTAIFSIVNATLFRPLPYPDPEQLVAVSNESLSAPDFLDLQAEAHVFEQMATYRERTYNMNSGDRPERIDGVDVTTNLFSLLRVDPVVGRNFGPEDGGRALDRAVILSQKLWEKQFAASKAVIGHSLTLDGQPFTVIGVMPAGFEFPSGSQLWVSPRYAVPEHPLRPEQDPANDRGGHYFGDVIARLKPGVTMQKAKADLDTVSAAIVQQHPDSDLQTNSPSLISLHEETVGDVRATLLVIFGVVILVFLIACANVANLMLSRGVARRKELAVRAVLGASRGRIIRQLITESVLLALIGGAIGVLVAFRGFAALVDLSSNDLGPIARPQVDGTVLIFTVAVSLFSALFFGLAPAFQGSRTRLNESVKEGGRSSSGGRSRCQEALIGIEVALAVILLVGAGLLLRSFVGLRSVSPGFDPDHVLTLSISLPPSRYAKPESKSLFVDNILKQISAVPGVTAASVISRLPLNPGNSTRSIKIDGRSYPSGSDGEPIAPDYLVVTPGYFATLHIPLLAGRDFTAHDDAAGPAAVIISKTAANTFWPDENPIGKRLLTESSGAQEIVGVVGDVLQHDLNRSPKPCVYVAYAQAPWPFMTVAARTALNPANMALDIERAVWAVDKDEAIANVRTMDETVLRSISQQRFTMLLVGLFAGLALVLATIGIFGVTSFAVGQRTHEIGVRVALGASRPKVLALVLGRSLLLTALGAGAGIAGALALAGLMSSMLFGVRPWDPITMAAVPAVLTASTLLASYLPARRAMKVDPAVALRYE